MPRLDIFAAALRALDDGRGVAIATVIGAHGSTPRHLGARMCVTDDGTQWGTIGGGRIEQVVVEAAKQVAAGAEPRVVRQHLVRDLAMCCGGSMEIVLTPAAPSREVLARAGSRGSTARAGSRGSTARAGSRGVRSGDVLLTPIEGEPLVLREARADDPPQLKPRVIDGALVERIGV